MTGDGELQQVPLPVPFDGDVDAELVGPVPAGCICRGNVSSVLSPAPSATVFGSATRSSAPAEPVGSTPSTAGGPGAIASMTAAIGGLDALVFTGGVGENAAEVRAPACRGLAHLGVHVDEKVNAEVAPDARLDTRASAVAVFVVSSREDLEMAAQARQVLGS